MYEMKQNTESLNPGLGERNEGDELDTESCSSEGEVISIDCVAELGTSGEIQEKEARDGSEQQPGKD